MKIKEAGKEMNSILKLGPFRSRLGCQIVFQSFVATRGSLYSKITECTNSPKSNNSEEVYSQQVCSRLKISPTNCRDGFLSRKFGTEYTQMASELVDWLAKKEFKFSVSAPFSLQSSIYINLPHFFHISIQTDPLAAGCIMSGKAVAESALLRDGVLLTVDCLEYGVSKVLEHENSENLFEHILKVQAELQGVHEDEGIFYTATGKILCNLTGHDEYEVGVTDAEYDRVIIRQTKFRKDAFSYIRAHRKEKKKRKP